MDAVIFDLDGTLFDSRATIRRCLNATMMEYGKEPFGEDVKDLIGKHLLEILALRGIGNEEAAERYRQIQMETYKEDMRLYDGVVDMLDALKDGGYKLGIATMRHGRITRGISGGMEIAHFFEVTVGVDETEKAKPDPDHVLTACRLLGVEPEKAIMVGDTKFDILSGKGAGCTAIGVSWGSGSPEELERAGSDYITNTVAELKDILMELKEQ